MENLRKVRYHHTCEGTRFGLILNAFMNAFGQSGAERTPERPPFEGICWHRQFLIKCFPEGERLTRYRVDFFFLAGCGRGTERLLRVNFELDSGEKV